MILYCWPCNTVQRYPPVEVEQIIYTLVGMLNTAEVDHFQGADKPTRASIEELVCLDQVRDASYDIEEYHEHVEQGVLCRRDWNREQGGRS